jgi:hypothetical protein
MAIWLIHFLLSSGEHTGCGKAKNSCFERLCIVKVMAGVSGLMRLNGQVLVTGTINQ